MFQVLFINFRSYDKLIDLLKEGGAGEKTLFLKIDKELLKEYRIQDVIMQIEDALKQLKVYPRFPYPCYLYSKEKIISSALPILYDDTDFPRHFNIRPHRAVAKEKSLLQKIEMLRKMIANHPLDDVFDLLENHRKAQRELKIVLNENQYYQELKAFYERE